MHIIGVIASDQDLMVDFEKAKRVSSNAIDMLAYQYGSEVSFNFAATIGVSLHLMGKCYDSSYKYNVVLPKSAEATAEHWFGWQQDDLIQGCQNAHSLTVCNEPITNMFERLIDSSNLVVVFWAGNKSGDVADAIRYAFKHNKVVLDGMQDFRMLTNGHLKKHKKIIK